MSVDKHVCVRENVCESICERDSVVQQDNIQERKRHPCVCACMNVCAGCKCVSVSVCKIAFML